MSTRESALVCAALSLRLKVVWSRSNPSMYHNLDYYSMTLLMCPNTLSQVTWSELQRASTEARLAKSWMSMATVSLWCSIKASTRSESLPTFSNSSQTLISSVVTRHLLELLAAPVTAIRQEILFSIMEAKTLD